MDLHDYWNVLRVIRTLAAEWCCTIEAAERRVQESIDRSWEAAQSDPEAKAHWDRYFPSGKPTAEQYVLRLGHAHESGEEVPFLFQE